MSSAQWNLRISLEHIDHNKSMYTNVNEESMYLASEYYLVDAYRPQQVDVFFDPDAIFEQASVVEVTVVRSTSS